MAYFSRITWVSQHQKGKSFWILIKQEMMDGSVLARPYANHILLKTDNDASTSPLTFYRPDALPAAQPTVSKH